MSILNANLATIWQILINSTFLKNLLRSEEENINPSANDINYLYEAYNKEIKLTALMPHFLDELTNYSLTAEIELTENMSQSDLTTDIQEQVTEIFQDTVIKGVQKTIEKLSDPLLRGKTRTASEFVLTNSLFAIEGILDFKEIIDSKFPGATDKILDLAVPVITSVIFVYSPPLAIALETSGLLRVVASLFKTENLQKAADFCNEKLDQIKEDKELEKAQLLVDNLGKIGDQLDVKPLSLYKASFNLSNEEISPSKPNLGLEFKLTIDVNRQFLQAIVDFSEKNMFHKKTEVDQFFVELKDLAVTKLAKNNFSVSIIDDYKKIFAETTKESLLKMQASSLVNKPLFTRIALADESYDLLQKTSVKYFVRLVKNHQITQKLEQISLGESLKIIQDQLTSVLKSRNIAKQKILTHLNKNKSIKNFTETYLGYQSTKNSSNKQAIIKTSNRGTNMYRG